MGSFFRTCTDVQCWILILFQICGLGSYNLSLHTPKEVNCQGISRGSTSYKGCKLFSFGELYVHFTRIRCLVDWYFVIIEVSLGTYKYVPNWAQAHEVAEERLSKQSPGWLSLLLPLEWTCPSEGQARHSWCHHIILLI